MGAVQGISVLTTGGTIDKQYFDALSQYQITDTMVARLLDVARVKLPFEIVEVLRKDSLELDDQDRARLVAAQIVPPGVYITMNGTVFPADKVVKDRERGAFVSRS